MTTMLALVVPFLAALSSQWPIPSDSELEPHLDQEVTGVVGTHPYGTSAAIREDSALILLQPFELDVGHGEPPLPNVVTVQLLAWSDRAGNELARHRGKLVKVRCRLTVSTMWGYRHASCTPMSMQLVGELTLQVQHPCELLHALDWRLEPIAFPRS